MQLNMTLKKIVIIIQKRIRGYLKKKWYKKIKKSAKMVKKLWRKYGWINKLKKKIILKRLKKN